MKSSTVEAGVLPVLVLDLDNSPEMEQAQQQLPSSEFEIARTGLQSLLASMNAPAPETHKIVEEYVTETQKSYGYDEVAALFSRFASILSEAKSP